MKRLLWLPWFGLALGQAACKGQEVMIFDMPMSGGSAGQAGMSGAAPGAAAAPSVAGQSSGGAAGMAGGAAAMAGGGAGGAGGTGGAAGSAGMAGGGGMVGTPCTMDAECSPGWRCEKVGCDAPSGVCEPRPVFLPPEPAPVCGCDGITYWNDAIRRQHGAVLDSMGECRASACSCEVGADCEKEGASCSHLVAPGEMCGHGTGACWVLPAACLPTGDPMLWRECGPNAPVPPLCVDTCTAIRSERPHVPPHHGDCK